MVKRTNLTYFSQYFCLRIRIADPEEVDPALLQFCSSQLKLLQLYRDIQHLHSAADTEACPENVEDTQTSNVHNMLIPLEYTVNTCYPTQQDSLEGVEDELSRVGPTLQRYAQLTSRPSVSFAQDSPDSPLPTQTFLSQLECTEEGELRVITTSEADWNQLGTAYMSITVYLSTFSHLKSIKFSFEI